MSGNSLLIEIDGVMKLFPPRTVALNDVSLSVREGTIHSVIGENGAGKSTLMKTLYGLIQRDRGEIRYRGESVAFNSPSQALRAGIGMVHQELMLIPSYSTLQNIILGDEPRGILGSVDQRSARERVEEILSRYHLETPLDKAVNELSIAQQQKVEIARLLWRNVSTLILDEPTAVLTPQETKILFDHLRKLRERNETILFVSHRLNEVLELSDMITVMRSGKVIDTAPNKSLTRADLTHMMVGRSLVPVVNTRKKAVDDSEGDTGARKPNVRCALRSVSTSPSSDGIGLEGLSLEVSAGSIIGVAGVAGNGQQALTELLTAQRVPTRGDIIIDGEHANRHSVVERREHLAYIPQDRKMVGTCQDATIIENSAMTHHRHTKPRNFASLASDLVKRFNVVIGSMKQPISNLSGGNQQKVVLGREFSLQRNLILLDQPTRGLDIGSIEYIQKAILAKREASASIILLSADLDELRDLCDHIVVLWKGKIVARLSPEEADRQTLGKYMLGLSQHTEEDVQESTQT